MEEYVSRRLEQNIVDPDPGMIYTRRKLHHLRSNSGNPVDDFSSTVTSSTRSTVIKVPSDGWGTSLVKAPLFTRADMDRHIGKSGKNIGGEKHAHHSVPTGFKKAKTYLEDEYLHAFQTNHDQQHFYFVLNASTVLEEMKALTT